MSRNNKLTKEKELLPEELEDETEIQDARLLDPHKVKEMTDISRENILVRVALHV